MNWKPIPGVPGYEVSDMGTVRRVRIGHNGWLPADVPGWTMKSKGYRFIHVLVEGRRKKLAIHRLVLLAFVGPPPTAKHEGAHGDRDKQNNVLTNLRWATPKENAEDRTRHGSQLGENSGTAKLRDVDIPIIFKRQAEGWTQRDIARELGVHQRTIHCVLSRKSWSHVSVPAEMRGSR